MSCVGLFSPMYAVIIQEVHAVLILLERGKYNIAKLLKVLYI